MVLLSILSPSSESSSSSSLSSLSSSSSLSSGTVIYIIGGSTGSAESTMTNKVYSYNTGTNVFLLLSPTGATFTARFGHKTVLYNGAIYVTGGYTGSASTGMINTLDIYNIAQIKWYSYNYADQFTGRFKHIAVLYNSYIYVVAGSVVNSNTGALNDVNVQELYKGLYTLTDYQTTPVVYTGTFTNRHLSSAVVYGNSIYTIGGVSTSDTKLNDVSIYDIPTGAWTTVTTTGTFAGKSHYTLIPYNDALYLIAGSTTAATYSTDIIKYTISSKVFSTVTYTPGTFTGRQAYAASIYGSIVYIIGGTTGTILSDVYTFDIATSTMTKVTPGGDAFNAVRHHSSNLYGTFIYIIGGDTGSAASANIYKYDTTTKVFTLLSPTGTFTARYGHKSVLYNDALYVTGGQTFSVTMFNILR